MKKYIFAFNTLINTCLELLFPTKCVGCKNKGDVICNNCLNNLHKTQRETVDDIFAIYDYKDPVVKRAIWEIKYHHGAYLGKKIGLLMKESLMEEINDLFLFSQGSPIYVIPVPISKNKKKSRGYNQSDIIAESFCKAINQTIFEFKNDIVYKKFDSIPQAKIKNKSKRLKNIKGSFGIKNEKEIRGKTIIIIDDVTTTGGTISEIIKILKKNGAKKVVGFTFAH